jgi:hypothetical protein
MLLRLLTRIMFQSKATNPSLFIARIAPWFPVALFVFALIYYGSYAFSGLDLNGEGGTIAVIAERIRHGSRPFVDTFLGYNLLWFYPIVWLFRIFGPNFTAVRMFFFILSALMALLAYRTVLRATHRPLISLLVGVVLILIPGIQFRNYLPFFGIANLMVVLEAFALPHQNSRLRQIWVLVATLLVSATFLVRIDLGLFFAVVFLGAALAYAVLGPEPRSTRIWALSASVLLLPISFLALHVPIGFYAQARGFGDPFWKQYTSQVADLDDRVLHLLPQPTPAKAIAVTATATPDVHPAQRSSDALAPTENNDRSNRPLPRWTNMFTSRWGKTRILVFLIYFPLLAGLIIGGATLVLAFYSFSIALRPTLSTSQDQRQQAGTDALILGISLASAFTLFPQYFFFRPDPQHVSEMMCVFLVTLACSCAIALDRLGSGNRLSRGMLTAWIALCLFSIYLYCDYGLGVPWMGSVARKKPNEIWFTADNGVTALLPPADAKESKDLFETIKAHSNRNDYVVCFPYAPTVNFMTNRRSYLYNLYVDNATRPAAFDQQAIAEIEKYRPAAILINDDPMNVVEASRFSIWAARTTAYIREHYRYAGTYRRNEVYLAPDK